MKIFKDTLFAQAVYGRPRLQIPTIVIGNPVPQSEEVPDEWVMCLGSGEIITKYRVDAFLYVSPKGFDANRERFKYFYIKGMPGRGENRDDWEYYKSNVLSWYDEVREANRKKILSLKKKIIQVENLIETIL